MSARSLDLNTVGLLVAGLPPGLTVPTAAETRAYAARMRAGGPDGTAARDEFFTRNIPLALHIARGHHARRGRPERPFADLVSSACEGLLLAVDRFDPDRGTRFSTYASYWIRQSIQRFIQADRLVAVPVYLQEAFAGSRSLAGEVRRPGADRLRAHCLEAGQAALEARVDRDPGWTAYTADPAPGPAERAELAEELAILGGWLGRLRAADPRLATVLVLRFGLDGGDPRTFREIGREIHRTAQRSQKLYEAALDRLREIAGVEAGAEAPARDERS